MALTRPVIDARPCPKCGGTEFSVRVLASARYRAGEFQAFEMDEPIIPIPTATAVCTGCQTERLYVPGAAEWTREFTQEVRK